MEEDKKISSHEAQRSSKAPFFIGVISGIFVACIIGISTFLVWYTTGGYTLFKASSDQNILLDEVTIDKINKINQTIDDYYYKDSEVPVEARRNSIFSGLVNSLGDVYSVYYTEEDVKQITMDTQGIYYGIGAYIGLNAELQRAYISGVIANSPAEEAGLRENDIIMAADGVDTEGMHTDEVAAMIRGKEGTDVTISLLRGEEKLEFTLTRRKVESPTVTYRMLDDKIGYLQIREFDEVTHDQFVEAYTELKNQDMKAMILDLRSNPGGQLSTVCEIADELLPKGEIVYTIDKLGHKETYTSSGKNEIKIPLVVLINGNSASASEILAGAIKDYKIGTLLGTTTFGKGIVQRIFFFEDGTGIKLTVSDYYTPSGNNIHGVGISPDIELEFDSESYADKKTDNQLNEAVEVIKKQIN